MLIFINQDEIRLTLIDLTYPSFSKNSK